MAQQAPSTIPLEPVPSDVSSTTGTGSVIVPPGPSDRGPALMWLAVVLGIVILGGGAYFFYVSGQPPVETVSKIPPSLVNLENKPNQGFDASIPTSTPTLAVTPTLTASDTVADIEKDLSGTTLESGNSSEFTADLQSL